MLMILKFTTQLGQKKECLYKDQCFCILVDLATFFVLLYVTIETNYNVWKSIFILCILYRISTFIHSHLSFYSYTSNLLLDFLMISTFVLFPLKVFCVSYIAKKTLSFYSSCHVLPVRIKSFSTPLQLYHISSKY